MTALSHSIRKSRRYPDSTLNLKRRRLDALLGQRSSQMNRLFSLIWWLIKNGFQQQTKNSELVRIVWSSVRRVIWLQLMMIERKLWTLVSVAMGVSLFENSSW